MIVMRIDEKKKKSRIFKIITNNVDLIMTE